MKKTDKKRHENVMGVSEFVNSDLYSQKNVREKVPNVLARLASEYIDK